MAFSQMNEDIAYVSRLDDEPSESAGMSAAALKAEFDRAGLALKSYINEVLLPELEGEGAAGKLGFSEVSGLTGAGSIQEAIAALERQLHDASMGSVAPDRVDSLRLRDSAVTAGKIAPGAVTEEKLAAESVDTGNICPAAVTNEKLSPGAVTETKLSSGAVTASKIAEGAVKTGALDGLSVTGEKIASGAVTEAKLAPEAVTKEHSGTLSKTLWQQQGEHFTQSMALPGLKGGSRVIADLDAGSVSGDALQTLCSDWGLILKAEADIGSVSFWASAAPEGNIPVKLLEVRR